MKRRSFLQATAALGTGSVIAAIPTASSQVAGQGQPGNPLPQEQATRHSAAHFFQDDAFNYVFLGMLGRAH